MYLMLLDGESLVSGLVDQENGLEEDDCVLDEEVLDADAHALAEPPPQVVQFL